MRISAVFSFIFLLIYISSCSIKSGKPILIGAIYNLHGSQASLDIASSHGVTMAIDDLNRAGGIHKRPLKLLLYDGYSNPDSIRVAASKLVKSKVSAIIGFSDTDMVIAAGNIISQENIPFITSGATAPRLEKNVPNVLYFSCFGDNVQAAAAAEFAKTKLNLNRVVLIHNNKMDYTKYLAEYFKQSWISMRGVLVSEISYGESDADEDNIIAQLKKHNADFGFIFLAAGPDEVGEWIKHIRTSGIKQTIIGGDGYDTELLLSEAGESADEIYFTTHTWMNETGNLDNLTKFIQAYRTRYGINPENSFAALGYDAVMLYANAAKNARKINNASILEGLQKTSDLNCLTGRIQFIDGSHIPIKEVTIIGINKGVKSLEAIMVPEKIPSP